MEDRKIIFPNDVKTRVRMKYNWSAFPILILIAVLDKSKIDTSIYFLIGIILGANYIPNLITLYLIKCPYCSKKYFTPQLCSDKELFKIFNSAPPCVNCNLKAAIFSGENLDQ